MPLDYDVVRTWPIPEMRQTYDARDTILYNLGVGAGVIAASDEADLDLVWEDRLKPVPTLAAILGEPSTWMRDPGSTITWTNMVHAEESIEWHRPVPVAGTVLTRSFVEEIYDKGEARGAIMVVRREVINTANDLPLATIRIGIFLRADGGFGGTATMPQVTGVPRDHAPDFERDFGTRPEQALLYRLSGDLYPLHVDPAFARAIGFARPILHGLATYGVAARGLVDLLCGGDPDRLRWMHARFTAPVYPGETIRLQVWQDAKGTAMFRALVENRIVLDNGGATVLP